MASTYVLRSSALLLGRGAQSDRGETSDDVFQAVTSLETIFKLREVVGHMFGFDGMVGASYTVLDVPDGRVEPFAAGHGAAGTGMVAVPSS